MKHFLVAVLFSLMIGGLVGCANNPAPSPVSSPAPAKHTFLVRGHNVSNMTVNGVAEPSDTDIVVVAVHMDALATPLTSGSHLDLTVDGSLYATDNFSSTGDNPLEVKY